MTDILPFGSSDSEATIDLGPQTFLGLSVVDINCTSSWDQQGGQCNLRLLQDTDQYLEEAVVGSPQFFEIETLSGEPVFRFYGILKELSRSVSASSKEYNAVIQSPTVLLEACSVITEGFAGYGGALEAAGANVPTCLDFGHINSNINPNRIFNIQNVFGVYENDSFGFGGAGFGKSNINEEGMRVDLFANALHELVNGNPNLTPKLGSNIIYGSDSYNGGNAYAYNFDINGFLSQIANYIPSNYRVKSTNLLDFINELCSLANFIYYIDLLKPVGAGLASFGSGHVTNLIPTQTHSGTVYGGQIIVITQNRNVVSGTRFPLSKEVILREVSDKNGGSGPDGSFPLDMGLTGTNHPEGPPVASSPYGGTFPVESIVPDSGVRYTSTNLSVRLNESAVAAKYIVGGFQSRMNYIKTAGISNNVSPEIAGSTCASPSFIDADTTADVYAYFGSINVSKRLLTNVPDVPVLVSLWQTGAYSPACIPIDVFDLFGNLTIQGVGYTNGILNTGPIINGIFFTDINFISFTASLGEDDQKQTEFKEWLNQFATRTNMMNAIIAYIGSKWFKNSPIFDINGNLNPLGRAIFTEALNIVNDADTSSTNSLIPQGGIIDEQMTSFLRKLYLRVKSIAKKHYGKTYAVKVPAFASAVDADSSAPLNSFIRSWDLSDNAYLDPANYKSYEAPFGDQFVSGGRLRAYATYDNKADPYSTGYYPDKNILVRYRQPSSNANAGFLIDAFTKKVYDLGITSLYPQGYFDPIQPDITSPTFNLEYFTEYSLNDMFFQRNNMQRDILSVPVDVQPNYVFLPSQYFTYSAIADIMSPVGSPYSFKYNMGNKATIFANFLKSLIIPPDGNGCIPFAIVETKGIFAEVQAVVRDIPERNDSPFGHLDAADSENKKILVAVHPRGFGIPQQSNRYVYGPWITETNLAYGARIEYVKDENLVPENYIMPSRINIGGVSVTVDTGYAGMNTIGQLTANTVENFDYFYTEEGTVTIPGLPVITNLGQALVAEGPLVSDISLNLTADSLSTQYSMKTFAPKMGRTNKFVIDRLTRLARKR